MDVRVLRRPTAIIAIAACSGCQRHLATDRVGGLQNESSVSREGAGGESKRLVVELGEVIAGGRVSADFTISGLDGHTSEIVSMHFLPSCSCHQGGVDFVGRAGDGSEVVRMWATAPAAPGEFTRP